MRSTRITASRHQYAFYREGGILPASPSWILGGVVTAPVAGAALVTLAGQAGKTTRIYGFMLGKEDLVGNLAQLRRGATIIMGFSLGSGQGVLYISPVPIDVGGSGVNFSINVLNAGAAGIDYSAALLGEQV